MIGTQIIKKEDFLKTFSTALDVNVIFQRPTEYKPTLNTINEAVDSLVSSSVKHNKNSINDSLKLHTNDPDSSVIERAQATADTLNIRQIKGSIEFFEYMLKNFPLYKKILYSFNIGNKHKISFANSNDKKLNALKNMLENKSKLPGSITYLLPDELVIPSFIPDIDQILYVTHYNEQNDFSIEKFSVVTIDVYDNYLYKSNDYYEDVFKNHIVKKPSNCLKFAVTLQSQNGKKITLNNKNLLDFNGASIDLAPNKKLFISRNDAVVHLHTIAEQTIENIQNSLKLIEEDSK